MELVFKFFYECLRKSLNSIILFGVENFNALNFSWNFSIFYLNFRIFSTFRERKRKFKVIASQVWPEGRGLLMVVICSHRASKKICFVWLLLTAYGFMACLRNGIALNMLIVLLRFIHLITSPPHELYRLVNPSHTNSVSKQVH
jgi:hypothetical protein